jgi:hypothetical protein
MVAQETTCLDKKCMFCIQTTVIINTAKDSRIHAHLTLITTQADKTNMLPCQTSTVIFTQES